MVHGLLGQQQFLWLAGVTSFLLNYAFCLALLTGFEFYRRYRDSQVRSAALERSLSAAHLAALRMQLSPHTLFNLLHTIRGNIAWEPAVAQSMIVQLSDLLRRLLRAGERELSRLQDELDFVRLYLQLQQRRFADRLSIRVPDNDALPAVWVPSLILQPLVENAVLHGLANHQASVAIRVEVLASGETLTLRVVNSVASGHAAGGNEQAGIGIRNVRERLAIQFGERASLSASAGSEHDWIAEIRMPLLRDGST
jgi:LytS/YehU family sensor histidine kinase